MTWPSQSSDLNPVDISIGNSFKVIHKHLKEFWMEKWSNFSHSIPSHLLCLFVEKYIQRATFFNL